MAIEEMEKKQSVSAADLALIIRAFRDMRQWSTLNAQIATSGQELVRLIEQADMNSSSSAVVLEGSAAEAFAGLVDYLRDYSECADCMSETEKLKVFADVQEYLEKAQRLIENIRIFQLERVSGSIGR